MKLHLKVYLGRGYLSDLPRLRGIGGALVDFRHVIAPLLASSGAFAHHAPGGTLYPSLVFRAAHDRLVGDCERPGVIEYLQVLKLAAEVSGGGGGSAQLQKCLAGADKWRAKTVWDEPGAAGKEGD